MAITASRNGNSQTVDAGATNAATAVNLFRASTGGGATKRFNGNAVMAIVLSVDSASSGPASFYVRGVDDDFDSANNRVESYTTVPVGGRITKAIGGGRGRIDLVKVFGANATISWHIEIA